MTPVIAAGWLVAYGGSMVATGENWRGRGVSIAFATDLGGGTFTPPEPKIDPKKKLGGEVAKEI